uniref:C2H2-type domain-containing protein n=1 Tax=Anopheles coluzzii TaxID=1518534 RepID=A0A6E8W6M8_ANOCL|nr:terminal uridylyltransferase Tailor-like [Anopheles coluzzii]
MNYLATNLLIESLTLNLASYKPGLKNIDTFTMNQIEKLMKKLELFLATSNLVQCEEDELQRDKIMMSFYQQPDTVRCRHCNESFSENVASTQHIQNNEGNEQKPKLEAISVNNPEAEQKTEFIEIHANDPEKGLKTEIVEIPLNVTQTKPIGNDPNDTLANDRKNIQLENHTNANTEISAKKMPKQKEIKPQVNYMKRRCLPRLNFKMSKDMKNFFKQDIMTVLEMAVAESDKVKSAIENKKVQEQLVECLKPHYPAVKCYPFGSRVIGTGSYTSDLDIFVDLQEVYYGRNDKPGVESITESILKVEKILKNTKQWTIDEIILNSRVPLLKVINHRFNMKCDLTFSNGLAHRNSLLLEYLLNLQPSSRMLVCYLKKWNREKYLNGYTISLMVIYFLQLMGWLPNVSTLQVDPQNDVIIDGWNAGFATPTLEELNHKSKPFEIIVLVEEFFHFYGFYANFIVLEIEVISPFYVDSSSVKTLLKSDFESPDYSRVPSQFKRLKQYLLKHKNDTNPRHQFAYNRPLVVQDPFELSHNVAKGISPEMAGRIIRLFEMSERKIKYHVYGMEYFLPKEEIW